LPISYAVDNVNRILSFTLSGELTTAEMVEMTGRAASDLDPASSYDVMPDHRGLLSPITPDQARAFAAWPSSPVSPFRGTHWVAIVTQPASYGMLLMLAVYIQEAGIIMEIVQSPEAALSWLTAVRA
jgi:hypothetical protein